MQPTSPQTSIVETNTIENSEWLRVMPVELANILPESVWNSLTVDQKKETLRRQPGLYEKYVGAGEKPATPAVESAPVVNNVEVASGVVVEQQQRIEKDPEFEKVLAEFKEANKEEENKPVPVMSKEDIKRVDEETAKSANIKTYKFFGYQPSQSTVTNAKQISDDGSVTDAKTWAATMIARIFGVFQ